MRDVAATTAGISRNMQAEPTPLAGGNLNGSGNTVHMLGQAGTGCGKINMARKPASFSPNYCGTV
jgi:hypothetical protein